MKFSIGTVSALALCLSLAPTVVPAQTLSKVEAKCASKLAKAAGKLSATVVKETSKCRNDDISGKATGACPSSANDAKIAKAADKLAGTVAKSCVSTCAASSDITCINDEGCPARPGVGEGFERCSAGAKGLPMDVANLGFPGAHCSPLDGTPIFPSQISDCVEATTTSASNALIELLYGSILNGSGVSEDAADCLRNTAKAAGKLVSTAFKGVAKCRDSIVKGKLAIEPEDCLTGDPKTAGKVSKAETKLTETIADSCTTATILELDLCGNGAGGTADVATAQACLVAGALEVVQSEEPIVALRPTQTVSLVESSYPPDPICGDGAVNQHRHPFSLVGEECDGADDSACPGQCFPPGDRFECTCATAKRLDFDTNALQTEIDTGWTGASHDSETVQGAGFVSNLSGCDCDVMTGGTCTGTTGDPVCDTSGTTGPRCSWDANSVSTYCDDYGDGDGVHTDDDCFVCDGFAANAGASCDDSNDCSPVCHDAAGTPSIPCPGGQGDCPAGEICRGQCLTDATCLLLPLSEPTPISSGGTATCLTTTFREDVFGTTNIVTGEREVFQRLRTTVFLGTNIAAPCPLCGGVCEGGTQDGEICEGTCSTSGDPCRFDADCPPSETCTTASADCPGGECSLELVCTGGTNDGEVCRVGGFTPSFGTTSSDCPPNPGLNISGDGLEINFFPSTTEPVSLAATIPCTAPGYELFDCPCPADGGRATRPNGCTTACNAGAEAGTGCGDGNTTAGLFTKCSGGLNAGKNCDDDLDCLGGFCDANPTHCLGDPAFERFQCTTNAECGTGTCVDACPSGRCVPLCLPDAGDPQDGFCPAGPIDYHCDGALDSFRPCSETEANGGCSATCSTSAGPCESDGDCPMGETCQGTCLRARLCEAGPDGELGTPDDITGAGICVADALDCFLDPIVGEGGDTINGEGDPDNVNTVTVYCVPATTNNTVNNAAGIGGPGRVRSKGLNHSNGFTSLP